MGARAWLALATASALLGSCRAGVKPTVFISADNYHGGATKDDLTISFHLSEDPGGTAACTGNPTYASEVGTMTADKVLSEDASLIKNFYAGWTIKATGGTGAPVAASTISAYDPLTRAITVGDPLNSATTGADTTYELTAGSCAAQYAARGSAGTAGMWSNCPEGCKFVGPIVNPEGYRAFVSGPIACTTVTPTSAAGVTTTTLLCPKNTVAADSSVLAAIDVKRQTVATTAAMTAAAVGQSFEIRDTVITGTLASSRTLTSSESAVAGFYVGWRIETEFPKASGTITAYSSGREMTVDWDEPTTCDTGFNLAATSCTPVNDATTSATTFTLTADCPAAPTNVPLLTQAKDDGGSPFNYQFAPGSLTSWDPISSVSGADLAKCTVHRSVDGIWSARVPAGAFTDAGGNPNVASTACTGLTTNVASAYDAGSGYTVAETAAGVAMCNQDEPYLVTSDVTAPTVTVTASDDNWHTSTSTGGLANGDRITFKFTLSEPLIKTTAATALLLPGGGTADGDLETGHQCANPVSWGTGTVYYLRCNAIPEGGVTSTAVNDRTISIEFAVNKFYDLANNGNAASSSAFTVISDHQAPAIAPTAADANGALVNGSFTNVDVTFTFTLSDPLSATALVPTDVAQTQYPYTISAPAAWTSHATDSGVMHSTAINCNGNAARGTFTVGAGTNLAPTLLCPALTSAISGGIAAYGLAEIPVSSMDVNARSITVASAHATIAAATGPGQTLQIIARYEKGTLASPHSSDTTALTVTLPTNPTLPDSSATSSTADDYYVGWTIETQLPTGTGVVTNYHGTNKVATIKWDSVVTDVGGTTTYTLTAPCSASPMNTNLVIEQVTTTDTVYIFRSGYAPTARTTDATGIANTGAAGAVAGGEDAGIHGVDSDANFAIECALMRPANREISAQIPASSFSDLAGNPNPASDPFLITMDQTPPTVSVTIYEADGVTTISDGGTTGSRAVIFKIVASEHVLSVDTASGAGLNGLVVNDVVIGSGTNEGCTNKKFWGWKDTYYVRCDWSNGQTAAVSIAQNKAKDLAGNLCSDGTDCLAEVSATFT